MWCTIYGSKYNFNSSQVVIFPYLTASKVFSCNWVSAATKILVFKILGALEKTKLRKTKSCFEINDAQSLSL